MLGSTFSQKDKCVNMLLKFVGARDAIKLALPGFRHSVEWWGLPTRLEWALAPNRGAGGPQTRSLAARMAFGRLRGPWAQELKSS